LYECRTASADGNSTIIFRVAFPFDIKFSCDTQQFVLTVLLVARRTNNRKVAGSRLTKVVCITVLTGNRMEVNCPLLPAATPSSEL